MTSRAEPKRYTIQCTTCNFKFETEGNKESTLMGQDTFNVLINHCRESGHEEMLVLICDTWRYRYDESRDEMIHIGHI